MRAIVGLGNPGAEYETTRHNAGFLFADALAKVWGLEPFKKPWRWRARVSKGEFSKRPITIVKPWTYMNRSGTALGPLLKQEGFDPLEDLLVVVDDVALPLGSFRLRALGSAGGHNGLKSIAGRLASNDYARLRIGIGPRPEDIDGADFVLDPFKSNELDELQELFPTLIDATACWVTDGIENAMNRFNRKGTERD